jgi:hypothetical protein
MAITHTVTKSAQKIRAEKQKKSVHMNARNAFEVKAVGNYFESI